MLRQRVSQVQQKKASNTNLIGYAILKKDGLTGKKYWVSWDGEGHNEVTFSGGQPLVFLPEGCQVGVRVELLAPKE